MNKFFIFLFLFFFSNLHSSEIKFEKIFDELDKPWSLSFIDSENVIITQKSGKLLVLNLKDKITNEIQHNLSIISLGQGGLLDVLYSGNQVYISYSENRGNWETSTSVAKGIFNKKKIKFKNIFFKDKIISKMKSKIKILTKIRKKIKIFYEKKNS